MVRRVGDVTTDIVLALQGGLYSEYFTNDLLSGVPALTKVDHNLDFEQTTSEITAIT